eukprot:scaffold5_cov331-Pavlova_lutheri.AAC.89
MAWVRAAESGDPHSRPSRWDCGSRSCTRCSAIERRGSSCLDSTMQEKPPSYVRGGGGRGKRRGHAKGSGKTETDA